MLDTQPITQTKCIVFMPARNCEMYAAEALRSLSRQTMDDIHVVYVDDASEDQTGWIARHYLNTLFHGRFDYIRNEEKFGKSRNIWEHLRPRAKDADFIAILDADDQLADPGILAEMAAYYSAGKDVVWSNFFTDTGFKGQNQQLDPSRSPRQQGWRTSHFFSFRAALLANIPESYFKDMHGQWFQGACDVALALPVLDQTRNYAFIPKHAYRYTASNPYSLHNLDSNSIGLSSALQSGNAKQIMQMKPLPILAEKEAEEAAVTHTSEPTTAPRPVSPPPESGAVQWQAKAAEYLLSEAPKILFAQSVIAKSLTPMQLVSLQQILRKTPGEVLCIGNGELALSIAALLDDDATKVTCLADNAVEAAAIQGKAALAGLEQSIRMIEAPRAPLRIGTYDCPFPSLSVLDGQGVFSVVIVDACGEKNQVAFGVLGLPALANHIATTGFHYCALTTDLGAADGIAEGALALAPSLTACSGAIGGTGCVIFANEKEA